MRLRFGEYLHASQECALVIGKQAVFSPRGNRLMTRETWQIEGVLHAADPAGLTLELARLRQAYARPAAVAGLFLDDGQTPTDHVVNAAETLGGVRVTRLEFPHGTGGEYSTFRHYRITLEADFPEAEPLLWEHVETVTFQGTGGPRHIFLETLDGPPQRQVIAPQTTYRAIQQGRVVGGTGYPSLPSPLWPGAELAPRRVVAWGTPRQTGTQWSHFPLEWRYEFESTLPLVGLPVLP